jgi:uncharacterized protein
VRVDPTGKTAGRGAYLHDRPSCWERGLKSGLAHALKTEIMEQDRDLLRAFMQSLPEESLEQDTAEASSGQSAQRPPVTEREETHG